MVCLEDVHFVYSFLENLSFQSSGHNRRVLQWLSQLKSGIKSIILDFTKIYVFQEGHKSFFQNIPLSLKVTKGQLILKYPFGFFKSTIKPMNIF